MSKSWRDNWERHPELKVRSGAQARSFVVRRRGNPGDLGFVKEVDKPGRRPRGRFVREVRIYETLRHEDLPQLLEHNAEELDERNPLYLVLEYVPGTTLQSFVDEGGPVDFEQAMGCIRPVGHLLSTMHRDAVAHRDLKPGNILLRDGSLAAPVVVDFGLSFIAEDETDLTNVNETVGNRFLSLPEHAVGGRDPRSDVAQLAGILYYLLTGLQPRTLSDGHGNKPHQTARGLTALTESLEPVHLRRLQSVFDQAFNPAIDDRFLSADDLLASLEGVTAPTAPATDYASMRAAIEEKWKASDGPRLAAIQDRLADAHETLRNAIQTVCDESRLTRVQTGALTEPTAPTPFAQSKYGVKPVGVTHTLRTYRIELRGPDDNVLLVDGEEVWRGPSLDVPELFDAIGQAALATLLMDPW